MKHIFGTDMKVGKSCIAFGQFDGLHKGHMAVIDELIKEKTSDSTSILLSLDYVCDSINEKVIYTEEEKELILRNSSIDLMLSYPFTADVKRMEPERFIKEILIDKLGAKTIVAGEKCRFGRDCKGSIMTLKHFESKYNYKVVCPKTVKYKGQAVTSKLIKDEICEGNINKANEFLGHAFKMIGEVVHGKAIGRTVGMPTANLKVADNKLMPQNGVYATLSEVDSKVVKGLTNIGLRPSVDNNDYITIETYLLDFSKDIYGKKIALDIHTYIRGVIKFSSIDEVKKQVDKDIHSIRKYLDNVKLLDVI
ncbi:riboflavin biosynthesis protein [Vallitalea longa]|uniref:Riboflavin biosynthesis protein n=1 Tax=Vallitalea longa TaxID=2936439 RepID=A0A9W5YFU8_9FIRM|nr:bifunctional riboflavin kinase/FAD synthetase [Vallitalea longa]GKX32021.1 riboflavin biosynthesis protein [Vallitalea longa]